jgi:hypothetical protein
MIRRAESRALRIEETPRIPLDGLVLAWTAVLPFPALTLAVWFADPPLADLALEAARTLAAALMLFFAGVRRGLSFRTEGGPRASQIVMMLWLFGLGLAALPAPPALACAWLAAGFASLMVLDPLAARRGEVPLHFARLRPAQMAVPLVSLLGIVGAAG